MHLRLITERMQRRSAIKEIQAELNKMEKDPCPLRVRGSSFLWLCYLLKQLIIINASALPFSCKRLILFFS